MTDLNVDGMALAPGVIETIISIAANEVEGVASVGSTTAGGLRAMFATKPPTQGIEIEVTDNDKLHISVRIDVYYGFVLPEVAAEIRSTVAEAVGCQIGVPVESVDVYIDGIQFAS